MQKKITFGGQAVIEGVMMRSPKHYAISIRKPNKKIITKIFKNKKESRFAKIPFVRGIFKLIDTLSVGMHALTFSANHGMESDQKLTKKEMALTIVLSIILTIFLFFFMPLALTRIFLSKSNNFVFNLVDGLLRLAIFFTYIYLISLMRDVKRLFEYHGAEHKVVNCYEAGLDLTVENCKRFSTAHARCGTTFLLLVFSISIIIFTFIPSDGFVQRFALRLLLLPVVAGISYEVLKFSAKNKKNILVRAIVLPGLALQKMTTREPDDMQIQVGIKALQALL